MTHPQLTKASYKELHGWHGGSGYTFVSEGTGSGIKMFNFQLFVAKDGRTRLNVGNRSIVLTEEQARGLEPFAYVDNDQIWITENSQPKAAGHVGLSSHRSNVPNLPGRR
jgi:hypothetical protein